MQSSWTTEVISRVIKDLTNMPYFILLHTGKCLFWVNVHRVKSNKYNFVVCKPCNLGWSLCWEDPRVYFFFSKRVPLTEKHWMVTVKCELDEVWCSNNCEKKLTLFKMNAQCYQSNLFNQKQKTFWSSTVTLCITISENLIHNNVTIQRCNANVSLTVQCLWIWELSHNSHNHNNQLYNTDRDAERSKKVCINADLAR